MAKMDRFDGFMPSAPPTNPWDSDGNYAPDYDLLETLLGVAVGTAQQSGIVAAAADRWAAEELRRAGFDMDEVWPRRQPPRVMPRDIKALVERGLTKKLRHEVEARFDKSGARAALPAEANVLGRAYTKQADVVIASWPAGIEVLISTKTMLSSYKKNLRNRFEEGYGDAKNLRGRHPLAALGFLYIIGADASESDKSFAIDMLRKLVTEPDVYDCACLLVLEGTQGIVSEADEIPDGRGAREEPASLVSTEPDDAGADEEEDEESDEVTNVKVAPVSLLQDQVPDDLSGPTFFNKLIRSALARTPVAMYPLVRDRLPG
jgi:hypothetical protein